MDYLTLKNVEDKFGVLIFAGGDGFVWQGLLRISWKPTSVRRLHRSRLESVRIYRLVLVYLGYLAFTNNAHFIATLQFRPI